MGRDDGTGRDASDCRRDSLGVPDTCQMPVYILYMNWLDGNAHVEESTSQIRPSRIRKAPGGSILLAQHRRIVASSRSVWVEHVDSSAC